MTKPQESDYASQAGYTRALEAYCAKIEPDAERYRWLSSNSERWAYLPSRYNNRIVSGFSANGTDYLGYSFAEAIEMAMKAAIGRETGEKS